MLEASRFQSVWQRLGSQDDGAMLFTQLLEAYVQPHRTYHTVSHVEDCLRQLDAAQSNGVQSNGVQKGAEHPAEVEVALWFHDAVYVPRAVDNEAQSALWARQVMHQSGMCSAVIDRIATMILATAHDRPPETLDCQLVLDVDLSILGQAQEPFAAYERCIRHEYNWVPEAQYCIKRAAVLERFLARSTIYHTPFFHERLEAQARRNLARSLAALREQATL